MDFQIKLSYPLLIASSIMLSACDSPKVAIDPIEEQKTVPQVNQAKNIPGPLEQGKAAGFIRNGIYAATLANPAPETPTTVEAGPTTSFGSGFSKTNTIEQGVDEDDRVKYDGNTLFIAAYPIWLEGEFEEPKVRVLTRNDDFSLTEQQSIEFDSEFDNIQGLYLHDNRLAVIGSDSPVYTLDATGFAPWIPHEPDLTVRFYDVQSTSDIQTISSITIDGTLLSTRRIDDSLYIVSSYVPYIAQLNVGNLTDQQKIDNYQTIQNASSAAIMPKLYEDGQASTMNDINQCYAPAAATSKDGHAQLITITRINLIDPTDRQSTCLSLYADIMYMSQQNLYVGASDGVQNTTFHKVELTDLSYQASGSISGILGTSNAALLKMDEKDDFLRVVSTRYTDSVPTHHLHVLQQQGQSLTEVATLPNEDQPEPIGKPNEEIYAVRFIDDKAYVVTFERLDPFYVIDLTDNTQPFIAGSLELPGFSSYLHPLKNDLVLGIGQEVNVSDVPDSGELVVLPVITSGMKASLFDVRDPANPVELGSVFAPDAYTPVEWDYKALSVLEHEGTYRFAFPIENWNATVDTGEGQASQEQTQNILVPLNSLMLLETDTLIANPVLQWKGNVDASNNAQHYIYSGEDRSIIHGDSIYYIHGNQVWLSHWLNPENLQGPF
ncbi:beta-propeller domain-containing protein [Aliiglaciecola litoralis]|uniref:Beta-propeller domain-containing protein n=1 Tax=Aliiglaciecola litoralis TaxID=582857 RepID=A0ABP3WQU8_9ALTE